MHMHIAFAYTSQRLACVARQSNGDEITVESRAPEVPWCLYWQALLMALNIAVSWRAERATLYAHQAAGDERCDGWATACERLAAWIPQGVEHVTITAGRNAALKIAEAWG